MTGTGMWNEDWEDPALRQVADKLQLYTVYLVVLRLLFQIRCNAQLLTWVNVRARVYLYGVTLHEEPITNVNPHGGAGKRTEAFGTSVSIGGAEGW